MEFKAFKDAAFKEALSLGCDAAEVYFTESEDFSVNMQNGELENYSVEHDFGVNFRVKVDGKDGFAYTELLDDPKPLVMKAIDNARAVETGEEQPMQGPCEYDKPEAPKSKASSMTPEEKIAYATELEKKLLAADESVKRTYYSGIQTVKHRVKLYNTLGLEAESEGELTASIAAPILVKNGESHSGFSIKSGDEVFDTDAMVKESLEKALEQFGASPVDSGEYRVIIRREAMRDMLAAFFPMFSADMAQKGMSLFAGKEGETVAAECVSIIDDPLRPENPRAFDAEGVPSVTSRVIDRGRLVTLLHNLKTAGKAGVASTSNAGRRASGPVGIAPSNFYMEAGKTDYDELVKKLDCGLIIFELGGLHAGLNPVSGDFSLIAKGLLVENGAAVRSVDQITVAGNFIEMLRSVEQIGSDIEFGIPFGGCYGAPSVMVKKLVVSGK